MVPDVPSHQVPGAREDPTGEPREPAASGSGPDHGTGGSVGEDRIGHLLVPRGGADLEVQAAEFDAGDEDHRIGIGSDERRGDRERVDRRVASHEADVRSGDVRRDSQELDQAMIDPR